MEKKFISDIKWGVIGWSVSTKTDKTVERLVPPITPHMISDINFFSTGIVINKNHSGICFSLTNLCQWTYLFYNNNNYDRNFNFICIDTVWWYLYLLLFLSFLLPAISWVIDIYFPLLFSPIYYFLFYAILFNLILSAILYLVSNSANSY